MSAMLDVGIKFTGGGTCRNQIVRMLHFRNSADDVLFSCTNLGDRRSQCCNNDTGYIVHQNDNCHKDCKYSIMLEMTDVTESDMGTYNALVQFEAGTSGQRRDIIKNFNIFIAPPSSVGGMLQDSLDHLLIFISLP